MTDPDFPEKVKLLIIDKLLIGGLIVFATCCGSWIIEKFRSKNAIDNEFTKLRDAKRIDFLDRQLSQFYYPIYVRLFIDNAVWDTMLNRDKADDELRANIGKAIEKDVIIPNHAEVVRIIQSNIHLLEDDPDLFKALLQYVRHVSVYRAMRSAGCYDKDPIYVGEPWPKDLLPSIEKATYDLQEKYDTLVAIAEKT